MNKMKITTKNGTVIEIEDDDIKEKGPENKSSLPQVSNSHKPPRLLDPEPVRESNHSQSQWLIGVLWNNFRTALIEIDRLEGEREKFEVYAEMLAEELRVVKYQKEIVKEREEMKWIQSGKYSQTLDKKFLGNGDVPDKEKLKDSLIKALEDYLAKEEDREEGSIEKERDDE